MIVAPARAVLRLALIGLIAVALAAAAATWVAPLFGRHLFSIQTASMEPTIAVGSAALVQARAPTDLAVGEIITYRLPNDVAVTHRIIEVIDESGELAFRTKGDSDRHPDAWLVPASAVIGSVDGSLPVLGFLIGLLGLPIGVVTLLSLAASLVTAMWLMDELAESSGTLGEAAT
jgi:signal peptidase I